MGANRRVSLGRTDALDCPVAERKVHLASRAARRLDRESGVREQALGDAVVSSVLLEADESPAGEPTLSSEARDQAEILERAEMGERGRGAYMEAGGDFLEARPPRIVLSGFDDSQCFDLTMGQLLESLHESVTTSSVYIGHPNY